MILKESTYLFRIEFKAISATIESESIPCHASTLRYNLNAPQNWR